MAADGGGPSHNDLKRVSRDDGRLDLTGAPEGFDALVMADIARSRGGLTVFIAVDAVGSRHTLDHEIALRRLEASGALLTTTEAALFEWCHSAEHPQFQAVRKLVLTDRASDRA